ncbi:MBL fold metallo-hydrolase [Sulfurospirillum arsenophilum]|uniref:MBL fold metallo-hydrolase n=1 Tax=Sulfurospirillum arsenophilum TaxID=56698 RepID=UPI0005A6C5CC|nr:MBL fold metallo-hydrolase [Sulfurospirillum arsenophilum]
MKFEFLGTADTGGIPLHQCHCAICEEARLNGINNRSTSAYLELDDGSVILFDAGDDLLSEKFNTTRIRAVFLTHFHADHCLGLIRLRKSVDTITCYIPDDIQGFGDLFIHKDSMEYHVLQPFESIEIAGIKIVAVPLLHSKLTHGYVIFTCKGVVAYLTDCASIPLESLAYLQSQTIDHLFIDAAYTPWFESKKHLNWESAGEYIERIKPKNGYLIHASCKTLLPLHEKKIRSKYPYIDKGFSIEV